MPTATVIDGKATAARIRDDLTREIATRVAGGAPRPGLRVVIVGDHPASRAYVRTKARVAAEIGIESAVVELKPDIATADLVERVADLNARVDVHGILVQLPLPSHVDAAAVIRAIDPAKDVDGFHPINVGRLFAAARPPDPGMLVPCTPLGCLRLLADLHTTAGLRGRQAVVVGRSNIVGKPMAALLLGADCTVTMAHSRTADLATITREADILVTAVGRAEMVRADWVKPGATVLDVGINRVADGSERGRLVGDVAFAEVCDVAGAISPVPGGVGPMTVATLMQNTLVAHAAQTGWPR